MIRVRELTRQVGHAAGKNLVAVGAIAAAIAVSRAIEQVRAQDEIWLTL